MPCSWERRKIRGSFKKFHLINICLQIKFTLVKVYCDIDASAWLTFADVLGACSHKAGGFAWRCASLVNCCRKTEKKSIKPGDAEGYGLCIDLILNGDQVIASYFNQLLRKVSTDDQCSTIHRHMSWGTAN